jgi:hypothetical protein
MALQDYRKIITRNSVLVHPSSYQFILPGHKADRFFEGSLVLIQATLTPDDPFSPFTSYLAKQDSVFSFCPELWLRACGSIPTRSWFLSHFLRHFHHDIGGHSLRAGGATALPEAGLPFQIIQALGRWSSDAFQIYIRRHPTLLAAQIPTSH